MANDVKNIVGILDECAALVEEYFGASPQPDYTTAGFSSRIVWLARDHGLRTIHSINRLLCDDDGNIVLGCVLLRPLYELAIRLLWASRKADGWQRLEFYHANEMRKWAEEFKVLQNPAIVKKGEELVQQHQQEAAHKWRDALGKPIKPAPSILDVLKDIEEQDVALRSVNWQEFGTTYLHDVLPNDLPRVACAH